MNIANITNMNTLGLLQSKLSTLQATRSIDSMNIPNIANMNTSGLLQRKPFKQETRSIDSMNIPKIEFIAYSYNFFNKYLKYKKIFLI